MLRGKMEKKYAYNKRLDVVSMAIVCVCVDFFSAVQLYCVTDTILMLMIISVQAFHVINSKICFE